MRRYREDHPADVCLARGTFNSHPYVMGAMHEFLQRLASEPVQRCTATWMRCGTAAPRRSMRASRPRTCRCRSPTCLRSGPSATRRASQYNWMFQYYLRAHGLALSWVGTGRFIFSHNYTDADFAAVADRILAAARDMDRDGWWWSDPTLTNRAIRRRLLREVLQAWWRGSSSTAPASHRPSDR